MIKKQIILILFMVFILSFLTTGCGYKNKIDAENIAQQIDKITVQIVNSNQFIDGTHYSLKLKNGSSYLIKQNEVYLEYPILKSNGSRSNECKIEATGNKLDIAPNEEVVLNAFMPIENYENNQLIDARHPALHIKGYLNEVKEINHFEESWGS